MRCFAEAVREMPPLTLLIGESESREFVFAELEKTPHLFVSGVTGTGKSAFINSVLLSMILKNNPNSLKFILFDSKIVEFSSFNRVPHMLLPTITDLSKLRSALQWAVWETHRRLSVFVGQGKRSLSEYNDLQAGVAGNQLERILIIIDDLSVALKHDAKVFEAIGEILLNGRTTGIHLIAVSQHTFTKEIKEVAKLIPSKVLFLTLSEKESKAMIGSSAAFSLESPGGAIYSTACGSNVKVKTILPSREEADAILSVSQRSFHGYREILIPPIEKEEKGPFEEADNDLFVEAVNVALETGQASTSMLQRRLRIGYSQASRLIDQMEAKGYVGPFEGSKPRMILITKEIWAKTISM